jgi:hypothetical protein
MKAAELVVACFLSLFAIATRGEAFASRVASGRICTLTYVLAASVYGLAIRGGPRRPTGSASMRGRPRRIDH